MGREGGKGRVWGAMSIKKREWVNGRKSETL